MTLLWSAPNPCGAPVAELLFYQNGRTKTRVYKDEL